ncbi:hypothetical protein [Adhaeribacter aerolatus]|nr:hypothetical protein [Adhaeribacter aerolatus]
MSVAVAFMVIGIHRVIVENSIAANYWIFMIVLACLMLYRYRNREK